MCLTLLYDVRPITVWLTETAIKRAPTPPISRPRQGVARPPSSLLKSSRPNQKTAKTMLALPNAVGRCFVSSVRPNSDVDRASA